MSLTRHSRIAAGVAVGAIALFAACSDLPVSPTKRSMAGADADPFYSTQSSDSAHAQKEAEEAAKKTAHDSAEQAKKAAERAKKKSKLVAPMVVDVLEWDHPALQKSESKVIGPHGGTLAIPGGARLVVPQGALSENVTISVTRLAGSIVAYEFEPHGLRFAVPARIEQPTDHTNLHGIGSVWKLTGAYFESVNSLNQDRGTATVTEFEPTFLSWDKKWIKFRIEHFSGYLVSSGRRGGEGGPGDGN